MTLTQIAQQTGLPVSSYQEWEQGRRIMDVEIYFRLAETLDTSVHYLVFGKLPKENPELKMIKMRLEKITESLVSLCEALTS